MSFRFASKPYDSHFDFYRDQYSHAMRETRCAGRLGARLIKTDQEAGDWSDAPTPDLVVTLIRRSVSQAHLDFGHERFQVKETRPNDLVVTGPQCATEIVVDCDHSLILFAVPYDRLLVLAGPDSGLPVDGDFGRLHRMMHRDAEVVRLLHSLWIEGAQGSLHGALGADGIVLQLAASLLQLRDRRETKNRSGLALSKLRRAVDYLEANLDRDVSLAELAAEVGLSPGHFCTVFKEKIGVTPHRYLLQRRIERAKSLILSGVPIAEVAIACGFASQQHLTTVFRQMVGAPPGTWRKQI